jgi:hypothetical protein
MGRIARTRAHHRVHELRVRQHSGINTRRQLRLAANDVFGLGAHAIPDRIERRKFRTLRIDLMHGHGRFSQNLMFRIGHYSTAGGPLS